MVNSDYALCFRGDLNRKAIMAEIRASLTKTFPQLTPVYLDILFSGAPVILQVGAKPQLELVLYRLSTKGMKCTLEAYDSSKEWEDFSRLRWELWASGESDLDSNQVAPITPLNEPVVETEQAAEVSSQADTPQVAALDDVALETEAKDSAKQADTEVDELAAEDTDSGDFVEFNFSEVDEPEVAEEAIEDVEPGGLSLVDNETYEVPLEEEAPISEVEIDLGKFELEERPKDD